MPAEQIVEVCRTCKFWSETSDSVGECRRYAPRPLASTVLEPPIPRPEAWWPITSKADWCGEWKR